MGGRGGSAPRARGRGGGARRRGRSPRAARSARARREPPAQGRESFRASAQGTSRATRYRAGARPPGAGAAHGSAAPAARARAPRTRRPARRCPRRCVAVAPLHRARSTPVSQGSPPPGQRCAGRLGVPLPLLAPGATARLHGIAGGPPGRVEASPLLMMPARQRELRNSSRVALMRASPQQSTLGGPQTRPFPTRNLRPLRWLGEARYLRLRNNCSCKGLSEDPRDRFRVQHPRGAPLSVLDAATGPNWFFEIFKKFFVFPILE